MQIVEKAALKKRGPEAIAPFASRLSRRWYVFWLGIRLKTPLPSPKLIPHTQY